MPTIKKMVATTSSDKTGENHDAIAVQTSAFLKGGGKIQYVANGVSGYVHGTVKAITPANTPTKK